MGSILGAAAVLGLVIFASLKAAGSKRGTAEQVKVTSIRCPTCGADATVHGNTWECGWCGDFGRYSRK